MVPRTIQPSSDRTRRGVLKAVGVALASGLTTSTTGCLSSLPPLGQKQTYGRVDVPSPDDSTYRSWLPAPATFENVNSHYSVTYTHPSPIKGDEPEEFIDRRARSKTNIDFFGIGYENYTAYLQCDFGTVIEADFEGSTVAETLTESGYEADDSYRGYNLFSRSDVPRRVAVRDGTVVWSSRRIHEHPAIEALIDTDAGDRQRYHDVSPSFERISESIGASRMVLIGPEFGGLTRRAELAGIGFRFKDGAVYQVINLLFPEGDIPPIEQVERDVREVEEWTDGADEFDSELNDRLATIEARIPRQRGGERTPFIDPPQVTWGVSHDADTETLTFHHEAGEAVAGDLLWADINPSVESTSSDGSQTGTPTLEATSIESIGAVNPLWEQEEQVNAGDSDSVAIGSALLEPNGNSVDLDNIRRVDILLAAHRSDTLRDNWRLFEYELE